MNKLINYKLSSYVIAQSINLIQGQAFCVDSLMTRFNQFEVLSLRVWKI